MQRKFNRDQLRKQVGNRNLRNAWQSFQMCKYKGESYHEICRGYSRRNK